MRQMWTIGASLKRFWKGKGGKNPPMNELLLEICKTLGSLLFLGCDYSATFLKLFTPVLICTSIHLNLPPFISTKTQQC